MFAKALLFVCAQAVIMQSISGQCIGAGWAEAPYLGSWAGAPYGAAGFCGAAPAFTGGSLPVASASPIPPNGVSVLSENAYCGELAVRGALPFLGTVGLEGAMPSAGSGSVAYGCGNGEVAMLTEDYAAAGIAGAAIGPFGYGGYGCGCGRFY
ncbi:chorion class B protein PC10-like [Bicyclus anynana]|uniref:Chorion class B protein PC10-like n=1 Tax=Bicyclus anynana TaxID=110368 RepID=A0A6J1NM44_BICAN|nr:chorion class B protein PC10-like [Bicyclus anynana]